jgi:hypothetical protein
MTRDRQITVAMQILDPKPRLRERCRAQIVDALDIVDRMGEQQRVAARAATKRSSQAWRSYHRACLRLQATRAALERAGWTHFGCIDPWDIECDLSFADPNEENWKRDTWRPPPETKAHSATRLARWLLDHWGVETALGRKSPWARLAAALYGDLNADLFRQMRIVQSELAAKS